MYPQLVAQFTCQNEAISDCIGLQTEFETLYICCSAIRMINVTHAAIQGISVTVRTPHVSGVVLQQCSHLHIQSMTYSSIQERDNGRNDFVSNECGNVAYESSDIEMDSLEVSNFSYGVWLYKSRNTSITNVSAAYNAIHNWNTGISMADSSDTSMTIVSAAHNGVDGIYLQESTNTSMIILSAVHNGGYGILLAFSTNTSMTNVSAAHNGDGGIYLGHSTDTNMMNVSAFHNQRSDIELMSIQPVSTLPTQHHLSLPITPQTLY